MRLVFLLLLLLRIIPLVAQDDPCWVLRPEFCLDEDIPEIKLEEKRSSMREWNMMLSAQKNTAGCKWSAQSSFKQMLKWQGKLLNTEFNIFDETIVECIPDSPVSVSRDILRLGLEGSSKSQEKLTKYQGGLVLHAQKFPVYEKRSDSLGAVRRVKISGPIFPAQLYPALGILAQWKQGAKLDIGLIGAKLTWKPDAFQEKQFNLEGGPRLQLTFTKVLFNQVQWEHYSFVFWNVSDIEIPEVEIRNLFEVKAGPHLKAGILTRYTYQSSRWPPGDFTGALSLDLQLTEGDD